MSKPFKNQPVRATVWVNDTPVEYVSLDIWQGYYCHHRFVIKLDYHVLEKNFMDSPEKHISLMGEKVIIEFQLGENLVSEYAFSGVVTNVRMKGEKGKHGYIVLEGASPTILLERGKQTAAYAEFTLKSLFDELLQEVRSDLINTVTAPDFQATIPFAMQYEETDFQFLKRMAILYGEPFFYAGTRLVLGKQKEQEAQTLIYDVDLTDFELGSQLIANEFGYTCYHFKTDSILDAEPSKEVENASGYVQQAAIQAGRSLTFSKKPVMPLDIAIESKEELDIQVKARRGRTASETIYLTATCKTCKAFIGNIVEVKLPESMAESQDLGRYRITEVHHSFDQNHRYECGFKAVPASLGYVPVPELQVNLAKPIRTIVVDNADPEELGRVRVRLPWQDRNIKYWLRVMALDAGSSKEVERNRGFVFIPEIGDSVLVDFEDGNPNKPFVMGSLFHGKNTESTKDNSIKRIATRSGHTIELNDSKEGDWGITIKDPNGNIIKLDTKGKNIEITAPESMTLNAKNIAFNAQEELSMLGRTIYKQAENMALEVGKSFQLEVNKYQLTANEYELGTTGNAKITANAKLELKGSQIEQAMGSGVTNPKMPQAVEALPPSTPRIEDESLESRMFSEENNELEKNANPKILAIDYLDAEGNKTELLGKTNFIAVKTVGMGGEKLELNLEDTESGEQVYVGTFYIPANEYTILTKFNLQRDYTVD